MNECVDVNGSRTYFPVLVTLCLVCLNAFECVCLHVPVYGVFVFIAVCKVLRIYGQSGRTSEAHMVREYLCQHLKQRLYNFLPFLKKKMYFKSLKSTWCLLQYCTSSQTRWSPKGPWSNNLKDFIPCDLHF